MCYEGVRNKRVFVSDVGTGREGPVYCIGVTVNGNECVLMVGLCDMCVCVCVCVCVEGDEVMTIR